MNGGNGVHSCARNIGVTVQVILRHHIGNLRAQSRRAEPRQLAPWLAAMGWLLCGQRQGRLETQGSGHPGSQASVRFPLASPAAPAPRASIVWIKILSNWDAGIGGIRTGSKKN